MAAALLAAAIGSAQAAESCEPGNPQAKPLAIDVADKAVQEGLTRSFEFGFSPTDTYPFDDIASSKDTCHRGTFPVGDNTAHLRGNGDLPPRWAQVDELPGIAFFLCLMPTPEAAAAAGGSSTLKLGPGRAMYAVTLATKSERFVFAFYDDIPDDKTLRNMAQQIMTGQGQILAVLDTENFTVSFAGSN